MELDPMTYKKIIFAIVVILAIWIIYVFYSVGRETFIKKFDHIRSQWKIVLFWFVIIVILILGYIALSKLGIIDGYLSE